MSLSTLSIKRPVLAIVMSIVIVLFGAIGFMTLGVREYPAVDPPIITVTTTYAGANADVIESQITEPLEESINGIAGIRSLTSVSREQRSQITIEFDLSIDLETAANDVRDRVSRSLRSLPIDADPPVIAKSDADANPIVLLTVESSSRDQLGVSDIASNTIKERLQSINGVSQINIWGEKKYSMRLWLDPAKLAAYGLTPADIRDAIKKENVELPSGKVEGNATELTVRTMGRLADPEAFNNMIIKSVDGRTVRLIDVGRAELGAENLTSLMKRNGVPMVGIVVLPQPGANYVAIADEVFKRLEIIKKDLPPDIKVGLGYDATIGIRHSIDEVVETIGIAFVLVVLIIFLFLRDWRTTLIPVLAIPVSLIGTFFIMYLLDFSINILTLLGIVLAIGLVVDDAIVVLENIYTKIEEGMRPLEAGLEGAKEIFFAVISTTIALVAVFLPVIFLQGFTGRLFREFGIVIAGSVLISAFVALTLTPMLSTRLIKGKSHSWFYRKTEVIFQKMTEGYRNALNGFMQHRWVAFAIMGLAAAMIYLLGTNVPSELAPLEDKSRLRVSSTAPEGSTFDFMNTYMDELAQMIKDSVPENAGVISLVAPGSGAANSGTIVLPLQDPEFRTTGRSQQQIADALGPPISRLTGARGFVTQEPTIGDRRSGLPVQYVLQAPTVEQIEKVLPKFLDEAGKDPTFSFVDVNLKFNKPEVQINIDREKARSLGVSVLDIAQTLQLAFSEQRLGYFIKEGKQYQVLGEFVREDRNDPRDLLTASVRSANGDLIQLDNLVSLSDESGPPQLYRYNLGDGLGEPRPRQDDRRGDRGDGRDRREDARPILLDGAGRLVARFRRELIEPPLCVPLRADADLSGAGRAVRELPRSGDHPADGAAGAGRRAPLPLVLQPDAQHLQPDRHHHARRPGDEERHPDRRVREPAEGGWSHGARGDPRRGGLPFPSDPDDEPRDDARHPADRPRARRRLAEPRLDGDRGDRRPPLLGRADALRDPGHLYLSLPCP
jgi:multidrug efflux pump